MQLFSPITIKNMTLKNRIVMSPMCMYSCLDESGKVSSWHKTHYASRAVGQVGLIIIEATAVTPQGRISVHDLGIWSDEHVEGLRELVQLVHEQDAKIGIQLAHAGRKSTDHGEIIAPSALRFNDSYKMPHAMTAEQIRETIEAFRQGAGRAAEAGLMSSRSMRRTVISINQFLSPLTNHREDEYGGSLEGRFRFLREVIEAVQEVWQGPLFVRVSANEYADGGLTIEDHVTIARMLRELGVDLLDVSSGGVVPVPIDVYPGYQVPLAERIKQETGMLTGTVGLITAPEQAEEILSNGRADLVFLGRELLRDPYWPRRAAAQLGIKIAPPVPYERGW